MNFAAFMLPRDKANHALWGYTAACVAAGLAPLVGIPRAEAAQIASFTVGLTKELYDWKWGTGFDLKDLGVTTLAGTPVALLFV